MTGHPIDPGEPDREVCFHGGAFFEAIGEEFADLGRRRTVINADVLDAWFPPAPSVLAALREHLPWLIRTSPPTNSRGLTRAIARARGLPPACVLPGAGSSDLIFLALREWLTPKSRVLLLDPTYGEYLHVCERVVGCTVDRLPLRRESHYRVDPEELAARSDEAYDLVVLVNPNNPTGRHLPREVLEDVLPRLPGKTRCWVDEAYVEYAGPGQSLESFAVGRPDVVVCKSLSKVYALSGVRAAYLAGSEETLAGLRPLTPPWAVGLPAQVAAVRALGEPDYYAARYRETRDLREALDRGVRSLLPDAEVIPAIGNYVLFHLPESGPDAAEVLRRCRSRDLFLRDFAATGWNAGGRALRIAVKDGETQARMLGILAEALAS